VTKHCPEGAELSRLVGRSGSPTRLLLIYRIERRIDP